MKEQLLLKDFLEYQFLSDIRFSPDGRRAAYVRSSCDPEANGYRSCLWVWNGETHTQMTGTGAERLFLWEDDTSLLFASLREDADKKALERGEERTVFYRISLNGGEAVRAFSVPLTVTAAEAAGHGRYILTARYDLAFSSLYELEGEALDARLKEKKEAADYEILDELPFYGNGLGYTNKVRSRLFLYDSASGSLTPISETLFDVEDVKFNDSHSVLYYTGEAFQSKRKFRQAVYSYDLASGVKTELMAPGAFSVFCIMPWGEDLLVMASDESRYGCNENPMFYFLRDGRLELLAPNEEALGSTVGSDCRCGGGFFCRVFRDTFYFITTRGHSSFVYALSRSGAVSPVLGGSGSVDLMDISQDGLLLYAGLEGDRLQELYAFDLASGESRRVSDFNGRIAETKDIRTPVPLDLTRGDLTLEGWVLFPRDYREGQRYPAILDIHGGPKTVYGTVFYHEMQVWANMGYFVFFMNPRGSDGRGNEFADLRGKYGTIDYEDLMDFTSAVLERCPDIDPERLGVTGGSYGGFMTNWIIGHTGRFRAAASQRSIANWVSLAHTSDIGEIFTSDQQAADTWGSMEKLWWHSPLKYACDVTTPTLFIHSNEDYRCPYSEGLQMYSALLEHGIEARLCMFKGENHELSRSGKPLHRVKRLEEITGWMEKHLKQASS